MTSCFRFGVLPTGVTLSPASLFSFGLVGNNLLGRSTNTPRILSGGVTLSPTKVIRAAFDVKRSLEENASGVQLGGGVEVFIPKDSQGYSIRGGAMQDTTQKTTYLTGGLGYVGEQFGFDVGIKKDVSGTPDGTTVLFSLRILGPIDDGNTQWMKGM